MPDHTEPSYPVRLYAYDLSNGLAKSMSVAWAGKYFEAIWHTAIVYDNHLEVFFGQGITTCHPGTSIHGKPIKIIELGETHIDLGTFLEYIDGLRSSWTPEAYHLLERNCNHFSNEVAGFLTGAAIPQEIIDLPKDFLATPLGSSMRPMIDQMFRGGNHPLPPIAHVPANNPTGLLQDVAALSFNASGRETLKICSTSSALSKLLETHRCVVANFTNEQGCPPCRAIAPVYKALAEEFSPADVATEVLGRKRDRHDKVRDVVFIKVDTNTSGELAGRYSIRATPTIKFFVDRKEIGEVKGANANELRTQVNLMLYIAYPPHPHAKLRLPRFKALSDQAVQYSQVPDLDKALSKLIEAINTHAPSLAADAAPVFETVVVPFLKGTTTLNDPTAFTRWNKYSTSLITVLPPVHSFPVLDFLRLGVTKVEYATKLADLPKEFDPISQAVRYAISKTDEGLARAFSLTLLRLLSNTIGSGMISRRIVQGPDRRPVTQYIINMLLSEDESVRVTACSVCYGLVCEWGASRTEWVEAEGEAWEAGLSSITGGDHEEWEMELMSALLEALKREKESAAKADIVHRLVATIGRLDYLSPYHISSLKVLSESLNLTQILNEVKLLKSLKDQKEIHELCEEVKKMFTSS